MKKYFLGFSAIVLAVAFSAFTTPTHKKTFNTDRIFQFVGANYLQATVEDPANWSYVADYTGQTLCTSSQKACKILIDASYTKVSGSTFIMRKNGVDTYPFVTLASLRNDPSGHPSIYDIDGNNSDGLATDQPLSTSVTHAAF